MAATEVPQRSGSNDAALQTMTAVYETLGAVGDDTAKLS
jgi:hypothetical protein